MQTARPNCSVKSSASAVFKELNYFSFQASVNKDKGVLVGAPKKNFLKKFPREKLEREHSLKFMMAASLRDVDELVLNKY